MKKLPRKPALLVVIVGSILILVIASRLNSVPMEKKEKFTIEAVSISEKQSRESLN